MALSDWSTTTTDALNNSWERIINFLPNLIGAIVVVVIGIIIGAILKWAVIRILEAARIQRFFEQIRFTDTLKKAGMKVDIPEVSGEFVKWLTIITFIISACDILGLTRVADLLDNILAYLPNVIVAVIIIFLGIIVANFIAQIVKAAAAGFGPRNASTISTIARYIIYVFVFLIALDQLQISTAILYTMIYGLVGAFAISFGLAFGLGGQGAAADLVKKLRDEFQK